MLSMAHVINKTYFPFSFLDLVVLAVGHLVRTSDFITVVEMLGKREKINKTKTKN